MYKYLLRLARLIFGLALYALGSVVAIKANIGYAPYDVLNSGVSNITGMLIGTAGIVLGFLFLLIAVLLGEKIGIGSILNMLLIGAFMNVFLALNFVPVMKEFWSGLLMLGLGLFLIAFATFFYVSSGLCAGPRDSLMVAIRRLTKWPVGLCRTLLEGTVVLIGWRLGGQAGLGTLISALGIGVAIQLVCILMKFDPAAVKQETLADTLKLFRGWAAGRRQR